MDYPSSSALRDMRTSGGTHHAPTIGCWRDTLVWGSVGGAGECGWVGVGGEDVKWVVHCRPLNGATSPDRGKLDAASLIVTGRIVVRQEEAGQVMAGLEVAWRGRQGSARMSSA